MSQPSSIPEVVFPNLKRRFSGITSTMIQVLPQQSLKLRIAVAGHPLPTVELPTISWSDLWKASAPGRKINPPILFHARRNDDMIVGVLLKYLFRRRLHLIFTSVAQRNHTALTRWLYGKMDTLLSTSERSASYLKRKPDAIIPHGTNIQTYFPAPDRSQAWVESRLPGQRGIGIFGRVRPNKGHAEFVESLITVLPDFPEFTAVIIGETLTKDEPFLEALKQRIAQAGLTQRFIWLGKRPFEEIPTWFRRMSLVAAVPHTEGFGLTCLEAMASGVPVVATRTGGFEMVIEPGINGQLVPLRDVDALQSAFRELFSDPERLEHMGKAARRRIEMGFTVECEADTLLALYREIQDRYR